MKMNNRGNFLLLVLLIQIILDATIVFDIPFARQVMGFFYLVFIPGMLILQLFELNNLDLPKTILFSAGLSIAFNMFLGLLINEAAPLIGILQPLSLTPLIVVLNCAVLVLCVLVLVKRRDKTVFGDQKVDFSLKSLLLLCLPFLSVIGARLVAVDPSNNVILLLMIVGIAISVIVATLSKKLIPSKYYPLLIVAIASALLLHFSLASDLLYGYDVQVEYFIARITGNSLRWNSTIPYIDVAFAKTNSMVSVAILPTVFSSILNLEHSWILKTVYPLIFSLVPLGLYSLYTMQMKRKAAFLSVFFFMANFVFFTEMLGLNKQMMAELFFVLLFIILLDKKMKPMNRKGFFIIFAAGLILSHYSMSFLFSGLLIFCLVVFYLLKKKSTSITLSLVMLLLVMQFTWYIYTSNSGPFEAFSTFIEDTLNSVRTQFFNPSARGEVVLKATGLTAPSTFGHWIGRMFAYATELAIIIGFLSVLFISKRKKRIFNREFMVLSSFNLLLLVVCLAVPFFAQGFNMTRFYHVQLFFLAPFCIVGGKFFVEYISRKRVSKKIVYIFLLFLLIPFFLYQTDFIYEVTGDDSWSIPLSKYRMPIGRQRGQGVVNQQEVFGVVWLKANVDIENTHIYAGEKYFVLCGGYGMLDREIVTHLRNETVVLPNSVISFSWMPWIFEHAGVSEAEMVANFSIIYANGDTVIYGNRP